jgi:hypothetical protein
VQLAAAPEAGWTIEQYADHVEFRSATEKIEVYADCGTGSPRFTVEGPRADDSSAGVPPAPTTATTTASTSEDGGGHGSDDPPGDDHGGSGGGGHGSDD